MSRLTGPSRFVWLPLALLLLFSYRLPFDQALADWCSLHQSGVVTTVSLLITDVGSPTVVLALGALLTAALFALGRRRQAVFVVLSVLGVSGLNEGLKQVVHRPPVQITAGLTPRTTVVRNQALIVQTPDLPRTVYSYPSGHAAGSLALLLAVGVLSWPTRRRTVVLTVCVVVAVLVGASRVYLWTHYLSDVLGGWSLAVAWVFLLSLTVLKLPHSDWSER
ncbi:phosphatase PAP2 family protein (plasmid) [Deinococcus radiomollis]|uniref:phosphatase PAP2 family protein n=1 Tax=Deinococcus radiomollis TaxID=468916 RepID=UPI003891C1CF